MMPFLKRHFYFTSKPKPKQCPSEPGGQKQPLVLHVCDFLFYLEEVVLIFLYPADRSAVRILSISLLIFQLQKILTSWIYIPADHSVTRILFTSLPGSRHGGTFQRTIVSAGSLTGLN